MIVRRDGWVGVRSTGVAVMLVAPASRKMVAARLRRVAMARGPLARPGTAARPASPGHFPLLGCPMDRR